MATNWKGRQLSITAKQQGTAAGADLLALLQAVTEDGHFSEEELAKLRGWLDANTAASLPGAAFLRDSVERVLADGRIDDGEWDELFEALVRVLPPAEREPVKNARNAVKMQEWRNRERERREAESRATASWDFMVAGVTFEGRSMIVDRFLSQGDELLLDREPANAFDKNAIAVRLATGQQVGYVPARIARDMAPLLDRGELYSAWCKKVLTGNYASVPVVIAAFEGADGTAPHSSPGRAAPRVSSSLEFGAASDARASTSSPSTLPGVLVAILIVAVFFLVVFATR